MNKKKQITIYDISEEAGVSIATVSRVLNDTQLLHHRSPNAQVFLLLEINGLPHGTALSFLRRYAPVNTALIIG